jgi:DNA/RNA endonuclease G (NUC1)
MAGCERLVQQEPSVSTLPVDPRGEDLQLLYNHGFEIGYDYRQRTALWVYYRLERQPKYLSAGRLCSYCADERVFNPVYDDEFPPGCSGYTHGHLAPSSAIAIYFGDYAQRETYYLSNIVVEIGWHNNGIWAQLEAIITLRRVDGIR